MNKEMGGWKDRLKTLKSLQTSTYTENLTYAYAGHKSLQLAVKTH